MEGNSEEASIPIKIKEEQEDFQTVTVTDVFKDEGNDTLEFKKESVFLIEKADPLYLKEETVKEEIHDSNVEQSELENHRSHHVCLVCNQQFGHLDQLRKHLFTEMHKKKVFTCDICKEPFLFAYYLQKHTKMAHDEAKEFFFKCVVCTKAFSRMESLRMHKQTHDASRETFKCDVCELIYLSKSALIMHKQRQHAAKKSFQCAICKKLYFNRDNLWAHKRTHVETVVKENFDCDICEKSFSNYRGLHTHNRIHNTALRERFECDVCNKLYATRGRLWKHKQAHDDPTVKERFKCDVCEKTFSSKSDVQRHKWRHEETVVYKRKECVEESSNLQLPIKDERTSFEEKPVTVTSENMEKLAIKMEIKQE